MDKTLAILILLANLLALNCQEGEVVPLDDYHSAENGKQSYSFSYGVSDAHTGDIKSVWETKEGDTVKGHYSVLEPDGTMRSVEYLASPTTGFTAVVNNENGQQTVPEAGRSMAEPKTMRDYEKYYDFVEDMGNDEYYERKRSKHPYNPYKEYSQRKRPKYPLDLEPSEYTHSITIKHPRDESSESEAHSHVGYSFDPNCKTKTKKESHENRDNPYSNIVDFDLNKHKYPTFPSESFRETFDRYAEPSNFEFEKIKPYPHSKFPKYEELKHTSSIEQNYPLIPDIPPPKKYYPDEISSRPKKKNRPHKVPEYASDDLDDYILVPKKKFKPTRVIEPNEYRPEPDEDYERPLYSSNYDEHDDYRYPIRGSSSTTKEVVRKIVKKRRSPIVNLLDIFDI